VIIKPDEVLSDFVDPIHAESVRFVRERIRPVTEILQRRTQTWTLSEMPPDWGRYQRRPKSLRKRNKYLRKEHYAQ
jgi:hypothetical protein